MRRDPDNFLSAAAIPLLLTLLVWVHVPERAAETFTAETAPIGSKPVTPDEPEIATAPISATPQPDPEASPSTEYKGDSDWSDATHLLGNHPEYAPSQSICRAVLSRDIPAADRPDHRLASAPSGCSPLALYYETPEERDPERARMCALSRASADRPDDARLVLMNIYANGEEVARDLDLAIHLACGLNVDPEEMHHRVMRLDRLRRDRWAGTDFDFVVDDQTSFSGALGVYYYVRINHERRAAELRTLTADWPREHRRALERLERAKSVYAEAHARAAFHRASPAGWIHWWPVEKVEEAFMTQLRALASGRIPHFSPVQIGATRQRIAYNHARSQRPMDSLAEPGPEDFDAAERAWRVYRDAFIELARLRSPRLSRARLATWLGRTRPDRYALNISLDPGSTTLPFDMDPSDDPTTHALP